MKFQHHIEESQLDISEKMEFIEMRYNPNFIQLKEYFCLTNL
jgi:hypothetical protein